MFTEILKIIPKIDKSALNAMEKALNSRFVKVAKKFGGGLLSVLKGGGVAGAALALIDKFLNPLKEVQEAIDKTLKNSDDLATNAKLFNTTAGRLAKLQAFAQSSGLDADNLAVLITKFQTAVAEAQADPTKQTSVRNFTDTTDFAEGFFEFIQAVQKMDKNDQIRVQQEVFGEKQILKIADFLQSDFNQLNRYFAKFDSNKLTEAINKNADLNDLADTLAAVRNLDDLQKKSKVLNEGIVTARDKSERIAMDRENQQIQNYQNLSAINDSVAKILGLVENLVGQLGKFITYVTPYIDRAVSAIEKLSLSKFFRGIFGGKDN